MSKARNGMYSQKLFAVMNSYEDVKDDISPMLLVSLAEA